MERRRFINVTAASAASAFAGLGFGRPFDTTAPRNNAGVSSAAHPDKTLNPNTAWLRDARWGVFSHFLPHMPSAPVPQDMTAAHWATRVNGFRADALADQLSSVNAAYYFITIGQAGDYFCSPNATYERLFGPSHGRLSSRDLIADIAKALGPKGIRLCVYLPALGAATPADQPRWQAVIREWSQRWGAAVSAWWIDGMYHRPEDYKTFTDVFKSGNPDALVAYNTGPVGMNRDQLMPATPYEDYLAGEVDFFLPTCGVRVFDGKSYYQGPNIAGDQLHFLNFLGAWWGTGEPRYSNELVLSWTGHVNDHGGTVTWDVPLDADGTIAPAFLRQLAALDGHSTVTCRSLLYEMTDAAALARWADKPWRNLQASALETSGRHNPGEFGSKAIGHFVRIEEKPDGRREWVLMEHEGPGAIVRMWAPNMAKDAVFRVYFDHDPAAAIEVNMMDFFYGKTLAHPPFAALTARGGNVFLPIPFSRACKVTVDKNVCGWAEPADLFYIIQYRAYVAGTDVKTFDGKTCQADEPLLTQRAKALDFPREGVASAGASSVIDKRLGPGETTEVLLREGSAAIDYLCVELRAGDMAGALRSTLLQMSFDGNQTVDCPAGDFFGSGAGLNPFSDWTRRVDADGTMACRWVMPYAKTASLRVVARGPQPVAVRVFVRYRPWIWDDRSMYFHSNWGMDKGINDLPPHNFNFITIKGRGLYVGDTLNVTSHSPRWWGEGPEKVRVDNESFPSQIGTGSEDYYGYAWGERTIFSAPFHAQPRIPKGPEFKGTTVNTRIRSLDAIPFSSALELNLEVLTQGSMAGEFSELDYGVATYWYGAPGAEGAWRALP